MLFLDYRKALKTEARRAAERHVQPGCFDLATVRRAPITVLPSGSAYIRLESATAMRRMHALFSAVAPVGRRAFVIVTDLLFDRLDEHTQRFIIAHEEGHIENGDTENPALASLDHSRCMANEYAADTYAVQKLGRAAAIRALIELRDFARRHWLLTGGFTTQRELNLRLLRITTPEHIH